MRVGDILNIFYQRAGERAETLSTLTGRSSCTNKSFLSEHIVEVLRMKGSVLAGTPAGRTVVVSVNIIP